LLPANAALALKCAKAQNEARKRINNDIRSVCSDYLPFAPELAEDVSQDIELALCVAVSKGKKITRAYVCKIIENRINDAWAKNFREDGFYTGVERKDQHPLRCEPKRLSYDEVADGLIFDEATNTSVPVSYERLGGTPASLGMAPESTLQTKESSQLLYEAMESAEGKDREKVATVWLRVVEKLTHAEIAKEFGRTERTIKRWYQEGCKYLRDWLKEEYGIDREWLYT